MSFHTKEYEKQEVCMRVLENLNPQKVFYYFEEICNIPHGSKDTKGISDYLVNFAKEHQLEYYQDELHNVIMIKEATKGYEDAAPIIIQGHMDMVCEKESDCEIDFEKDGLSLYVDGDFIKAKGTTLGGDDGVAVAYALALLDAKDLSHPRLEVILTVDEEIGMEGAIGIDLSMLKGKTMLNIDSDVEGEFLTSCAGGVRVNAQIPVSRVEMEGDVVTIKLVGLEGGHSGGEIHKEHGNADILMGRVLKMISEVTPLGIVELSGGLKDNAIPREAFAQIVVPSGNADAVSSVVAMVERELKSELTVSDPQVKIIFKTEEIKKANCLDMTSTSKIIYYLRTVPNGVMNMSTIMPGLVETSLNLGIMNLTEDMFITDTSIRSSVSSRKDDVKNRLIGIIELLGGETSESGEYPAWEYKMESSLRPLVDEVYFDLFKTHPTFCAIHAGLECGILSEKIEGLDCVSFGPTNYDIHTPKERLSISSTQRYWEFLVELLKRAK